MGLLIIQFALVAALQLLRVAADSLDQDVNQLSSEFKLLALSELPVPAYRQQVLWSGLRALDSRLSYSRSGARFDEGVAAGNEVFEELAEDLVVVGQVE